MTGRGWETAGIWTGWAHSGPVPGLEILGVDDGTLTGLRMPGRDSSAPGAYGAAGRLGGGVRRDAGVRRA